MNRCLLGGSTARSNFGMPGLSGFAGLPSDEAIGRSSHSLLRTKFPIDLAEVRSRLRNDGYWSGELHHLCKDGREVIVDSSMQLFGDETVLEVNRDVTSLRESEARLPINSVNCRFQRRRNREQEPRWRDHKLEQGRFERVFGYAAEEAIGKAILIVIPIDRHDEEKRTILTRIRRGSRTDQFETIRQRKDGSLINLSST